MVADIVWNALPEVAGIATDLVLANKGHKVIHPPKAIEGQAYAADTIEVPAGLPGKGSGNYIA